MKICCPKCGYVRQMPDQQIPDGILTAKCPECGCQFPFSKSSQESDGEDPEVKEKLISLEKPKILLDKDEEIHHQNADPSPNQEEIQQNSDGASDSESQKDGKKVISVNPWDFAPRPYGYFAAFYRTCLNIMFAPRLFFYGLADVSSLRKGFSFYAILCILQIACERLWASFFLKYVLPASGDPQVQKLAELFSSQDAALAYTLLKVGFMLAQIFLLSGMLCWVWQLFTRRRIAYSRVFQVLAYAEAPGLLCLIPLGSLAALVWGVYCTLIGFRYAFGFTWLELLSGLVPSVVCYVLLQSWLVGLILGV